MGIKFPYTQQRDGGVIRYRRPVPPDLQPTIGKANITRVLGASKKEAAGNWGAAHREVEAILAEARATLIGIPPVGRDDGEYAAHQRLELRLAAAGFDGIAVPTVASPDLPEDNIDRSLLADQLLDSFPLDPETGEPVVPASDLAFIRALNNGLPARPAPTLTNAAKAYLAEKVKGDDRKAKASRQRVARVMARALDVLGGDRGIDLIRRTDALKIRDRLLRDYSKAATAKRYLNPLKALVKHGIWEAELGTASPFDGVTIEVAGVAQEERRPFTQGEMLAIRERIRASGNADLFDIWTLLEFTGCRLQEIGGLSKSEVFLGSSPCGHLQLRWTETRRLKTKSSARDVPLLQPAIEATERALARSGSSAAVFPKYASDGAGEVLSATLMKHVRAVVGDPLAVTHSLRHSMQDALLGAQVPEDVIDRLLGHGPGAGMSRRYGGKAGVLAVTSAALAKAFPAHVPVPRTASS